MTVSLFFFFIREQLDNWSFHEDSRFYGSVIFLFLNGNWSFHDDSGQQLDNWSLHDDSGQQLDIWSLHEYSKHCVSRLDSDRSIIFWRHPVGSPIIFGGWLFNCCLGCAVGGPIILGWWFHFEDSMLDLSNLCVSYNPGLKHGYSLELLLCNCNCALVRIILSREQLV